MKDYYYFLGIKPNASSEDIKKAYRKLSLKYHPDKNENDEFFAERFREIKEAYETLMNEDSRKVYDQRFGSFQRSQKSMLPPKIKNFHADKIRAQKGDEITIHWQTYDADLVKITPFGLEKSQGDRKFRIKEFDKEGKFQIILHATNTLLHKTVVQGITIIEVSGEIKTSIKEDVPVQNSTTAPQKKEEVNAHFYYKLLAIILLALALYLVFRQ